MIQSRPLYRTKITSRDRRPRQAALALSFFCFALTALSCAPGQARQAEQGILDLRAHDFASPVELTGDWEFFWQSQLTPNDFKNPDAIPQSGLVLIPGLWQGVEVDPDTTLPGQGFATYRLQVLLPAGAPRLGLKLLDSVSAYRLYADGRLYGGSGTVGQNPGQSKPDYRTRIIALEETGPRLELIIQVSNFHQRDGGIWAPIVLGEVDAVRLMRERRAGFEMFLLGALLIMGIYHIGLFVLRVNDRSTLFFGLFCFCITLRVAVTGERFLHDLEILPWFVLMKIEYASMYLSVPIFLMFMRSLYAGETARIFVRVLVAVSLLCTLLVIVTPVNVFAHSFDYFQFVLLATVGFVIWVLGRAIMRGREGAVIAGVCSLLFAVAVINDILYNQQYIQSVQMVGWGLFIFIFFQSFILSVRFSRAFATIEAMSENLKRFNAAYSKFVPTEFLKFLQKDSILDIRLGDQIQAEMTILFSDIRSFSELSETMTPKENFDFLNGFLNMVGPLVRKNGGFIDKYLGDGVMALFPEKPEDALRTAMDIHRELALFNQDRVGQGREAIRVGIGVHTGMAMLGTVGEEERMDGTVISDAVNLAARLEGLSKMYGASTIVSKDTMYRMADPHAFAYRFAGRVRVKGKKKAVPIFEVFEGDEPESRSRKEASREKFEEAVFLYQEVNLDEAQLRFEALQADHPDDQGVALFLRRIDKLRKRGVRSKSGSTVPTAEILA